MFRNNNFSLIETEASKKLVFICSMKLKKKYFNNRIIKN